MKALVLPKATNPNIGSIPNNVHRVVIIGANGSGKTRFSRQLAQLSGPESISINALSALYTANMANYDSGDYYDQLFLESTILDSEKSRAQTQLERLLALMMNDELLQLLARKIKAHTGKNITKTPKGNDKQKTETSNNCYECTIMDSVIDLFNTIFPNNSILVEGGRFLFSRQGSTDHYPSMRLSDGERAVLYYAIAILYAPKDVNIIIKSPEIFLHPTTTQALWNRLEILRPDCRFVYTTHDLGFAASRQGAVTIWVRGWDSKKNKYDYSLLDADSPIGENIYMAIMGDRNNVLFVEGNSRNSIDAKLYALLFRDYTIKSVGSCNRVIEATRIFNTLSDFHHMHAMGIVDRDRRAEGEVEYLRRRNILVPDVAEIENIFMLKDIVCAVAADCGRDPERVFAKVRRSVINGFNAELESQALEHTRHNMKKTVEYRVDGRFNDINELEQHISKLYDELNPRGIYNEFYQRFTRFVKDGDYNSILLVYNHKSMIAASNVASLCGFHNQDQYINRVLHLLAGDSPEAERIRNTALHTLRTQRI